MVDQVKYMYLFKTMLPFQSVKSVFLDRDAWKWYPTDTTDTPLISGTTDIPDTTDLSDTTDIPLISGTTSQWRIAEL